MRKGRGEIPAHFRCTGLNGNVDGVHQSSNSYTELTHFMSTGT